MRDNMTGELQTIEEEVRRQTAGFHHSTPLITAQYKNDAGAYQELSLDLRDMLIVFAISGSNVLISGSTGGGKTSIARGVQRAIFSDNFGFIQMDAKFDESKYRDIDFDVIAGKDNGNAQNGGNTLSNAATPSKALTAPALVIDELNRAPPVIQNLIQGWLTNGIVIIEGAREVRPGVTIPGDAAKGVPDIHYQWKVATINEGSSYVATNEIDKASRNRFSAEIPLDIFPASDTDRRAMLNQGKFREDQMPTNGNLVEQLFAMHREALAYPIANTATEFGLYVLKHDLCYRSPTGTKLGFDEFTVELCKGCNARGDNKEICGCVFAPSERAVTDLLEISQAFAMYRAYKLPGTPPQVTLQDVSALMPFVLFKKMDINDGWIETYGDKSTWNSTALVLTELRDRWRTSVNDMKDVIDAEVNGRPLDDRLRMQRDKAILRDPAIGQQSDMLHIFSERKKGKMTA